MSRFPNQRRAVAAALLSLAATLGLASAAPPDREPPESRGPRAIPVDAGKARFRIATPGKGSKTVVAVSVLDRSTRLYPIRIRTSATTRQEPTPTGVTSILTPKQAHATPVPAMAPVLRKPPAPARTFHVLVKEGDVSSPSNYRAVRGRLAAVGREVQVYVDEADVVGPDLVREVVTTFDDRIHPFASRHWGAARDVDGDGRFTVFLTRWLARLGNGRLAADGFVRGADFDPNVGSPFGNRCDMLYLNASLRPGPHLKTVLAHEYTHAVIFTRKSLAPDGSRVEGEEEGWIDEALAHLAEDQFGFSRSNLDYRVEAFLAAPDRHRLVVEDYFAANLFRSHGHRGATYLFWRWCADEFGADLVSTLITSSHRGIAGLEAATNTSFADLFRGWSIALARSGLRESSEPPRADVPRRETVDGRLGGPRMTWLSAGESESYESAGTAVHFAVVGASETGMIEVEIDGPADSQLQVTTIPLPDGLPRLKIDARLAGTADEGRLSLRVRELDGAETRLESFSWSSLSPTTGGRPTSRALSGPDLAAAFPSSKVPGLGFVDSRVIGLTGTPPDFEPLLLKLVGVDAKGRRVAAWAVVPSKSAFESDSKDEISHAR